MASSTDFLEALCHKIYSAENAARGEAFSNAHGTERPMEFLILRKDKVRVEMRKENVGHHEPHIHITHSDKIDASISIRSFDVLAGDIDKKTLRHMVGVLAPVKEELLSIWHELNKKDNSISAEVMISNLFA